MADFGAGELDAFRAEVKAWLEANYPAELRDPKVASDPEAVWGGRAFAGSSDPQAVWMRAMAQKGWTAPTWPTEYGGGGLTPQQARVLDQELAAGRYRAPLASFGVWMLGPVLLEYGDEAQKKEYLPKIINGEIRWCQGYSEPGAGSDLASLQTRCEDKGDHWLINGQKVWTSYANKADWCFCLVRTDTTKKHEGISFVLIDMASPGVETRPIQLISGESPFCETFFTDLKLPKEALVGKVNGGWEIAKRLLQYERQNISGGFGGGGGAGGAAGDLGNIAKTYAGVDATGRVADRDLRQRVTQNKMNFQALGQTIARTAAEARASNGPSAATSIIKYAAASFAQERSELMVEAMGHQGLGWDGEGYEPGELLAVRGWLRSKGNSIEGGTSEININVVSKRVLGLPDPK
ncbi:MAG: acyl-CoA dehydrogenase family protein [Pseudomonadota bacterium]|uniref:acyl-CoA dehydrogenase family protein n=1 Tax=unclassified Phenylobacterium TaxID=2640670 RepID=UPI0006F27E05|nr:MULTISPECIES: acyl-CoA dehydrogenase family protein [unclassified Phenylobacterium]KRB48743.1 acyl-CoA dehydrogenase [Phenylobacterium sp. Root700]MBT9473752.1 acyl-CoA dehydrogenase family protein [Phenylobacterium sp.]